MYRVTGENVPSRGNWMGRGLEEPRDINKSQYQEERSGVSWDAVGQEATRQDFTAFVATLTMTLVRS